MVKKLFKHEFRSWLRIMPIIYIIIVAMASMHRLLQCFEAHNVYYDITFFSATFTFVLAAYAALCTPAVVSVVRFYKNMFTSEGYLTMTLPVTPANHLWVKSITTICFGFLTSAVMVLSLVIITAGDLFTEIWKAAAYLIRSFCENIPRDILIHCVFYILELGVLLLVSAFYNCLLYYLCLCIGQLFRKARILASIGAFFAYGMIVDAISTCFSLGFTMLDLAGVLENIWKAIDRIGVENAAHIFFVLAILGSCVTGLVFFLLCHTILRKKLNLE